MATVNAGTPADIATLNPPLIDKLIKEGKVVGSRVDFARAGIGVAVKAGAPKPDLCATPKPSCACCAMPSRSAIRRQARA